MSDSTASNAIEPPDHVLEISTSDAGFYQGFNTQVAVTSKVIVALLILWAVVFPEAAAAVLTSINDVLINNFGRWYIYLSGMLVLVCIGLALIPQAGVLRLGQPGDAPEFSRFSWFSMMFGAGIGVGMLTYSTGEPLFHFQDNPDVILGQVEAVTLENLRPAYTYSFLHWGLTAWSIYALTGLAFGYFAYRRSLPLTIRSSVTELFGGRLSGGLGHAIDVIAVVATIIGVAQTLGFGVEQFVAGLYRIGFGDWLMDADGSSSNAAIIFALAVIVGGATISALSGVGRGIKWLSNINMVLSFGLLAFFLVFGATLFSLETLVLGTWDYLLALPGLLFAVHPQDGTVTGDALAQWQGDWTVFYWAWWIAFAPFVGLFLARVSRGRTLREYLVGAILVPSMMCFIWFAIVGGTAIDLELSGAAEGSILGAGLSDQLFATLAVMLPPALMVFFSIMVVILLLTYLVTSVDSAILIVNTINAAGDEGPKARPHILFWGGALSLVVGSLLIIGGLDAIRNAMIIGALPFSVVMALMVLSIIKAIVGDAVRLKHGVRATSP